MKYWLAREKYDDLLRKNANIRGEKGKFSLYLGGKKYHF